MEYLTFLTQLDAIAKAPLGGLDAQFKLAPATRKIVSMKVPQDAKKAAVLVLFYPDKHNKTNTALTLRAKYQGTHSAQVSFPGGKVDKNDQNLKETALRECYEEIGVPTEKIKLLKKMTEVYIPPSNFLVTPFLAYTIEKPSFSCNKEVAQLIDVPLNELLDDDAIRFESKNLSGATNVEIPYFQFDNFKVWGATAMIISEVKELLKSLSF